MPTALVNTRSAVLLVVLVAGCTRPDATGTSKVNGEATTTTRDYAAPQGIEELVRCAREYLEERGAIQISANKSPMNPAGFQEIRNFTAAVDDSQVVLIGRNETTNRT